MKRFAMPLALILFTLAFLASGCGNSPAPTPAPSPTPPAGKAAPSPETAAPLQPTPRAHVLPTPNAAQTIVPTPSAKATRPAPSPTPPPRVPGGVKDEILASYGQPDEEKTRALKDHLVTKYGTPPNKAGWYDSVHGCAMVAANSGNIAVFVFDDDRAKMAQARAKLFYAPLEIARLVFVDASGKVLSDTQNIAR